MTSRVPQLIEGKYRRNIPAPNRGSVWRGIWCVLCCLPLAGLAQMDASKRVLVLYDYSRGFSPVEGTLNWAYFEGSLNWGLMHKVAIDREGMDFDRVNTPALEEIQNRYYREKYAPNPPDAIIAVGRRTLDYLLKYGDELFPATPIISVGMDIRQVQARKLPPRVTGRAVRIAYGPTRSLALALKPGTENVAVIIGASPGERELEKVVRKEFAGQPHAPAFRYFVGLPLDDLLKQVATLPPKTVILFVSYFQDDGEHYYLPSDVISRISTAANAPTFITSDDVLDYGAVGGDLIGCGDLGQEAVRLTLRVVGGERSSDIPFAESSPRYKFLDARQLARWEIAESLVPAGTRVFHKVSTPWDKYRWQIIGAITLIGTQAALISFLLLQRKRRRLAEQALTLSEARKHEAVLEERNRLARDIHDTLAQGLTGVIVQLGAAKKAFAHDSAVAAHQHIQQAEEAARHSLGEARRSIKALRPSALERGNLAVVLADLIQKMTADTGVRTEFTTAGEPAALNPQTEENLLRIQQEILANALKHSGATLISTKLTFGENDIRLVVQDNGAGFDPAAAHEGYGLIGIRERVALMQGHVTIETARAAGTRYAIVLPSTRANYGYEKNQVIRR
jgi:signal transduction histidine kinase